MAQDKKEEEKPAIYKMSDSDGRMKQRQVSSFRSWISSEPGAEFAPEAGRYVLYINRGCPWAHRANLVRSYKGLEDIIQLVVMDYVLTPIGWTFTGRHGTAPKDPLYGFTEHRQLYFKADSDYSARYTVPVLWDKQRETIVNNESSEIIRIFFSAFDSLLPASKRESAHPAGGLLPPHLEKDIDALNAWVYDTVNNGVYKAGFATSQLGYEEAIGPLFASLDRLEAILARNEADGKGPYLFGEYVTEADIRLYPTLARFDVAYYTIFKCNLKMIRFEYPQLQKYYMRLYYDKSDAFKSTTDFRAIKEGYAGSLRDKITPLGPVPNIYPEEWLASHS